MLEAGEQGLGQLRTYGYGSNAHGGERRNRAPRKVCVTKPDDRNGAWHGNTPPQAGTHCRQGIQVAVTNYGRWRVRLLEQALHRCLGGVAPMHRRSRGHAPPAERIGHPRGGRGREGDDAEPAMAQVEQITACELRTAAAAPVDERLAARFVANGDPRQPAPSQHRGEFVRMCRISQHQPFGAAAQQLLQRASRTGPPRSLRGDDHQAVTRRREPTFERGQGVGQVRLRQATDHDPDQA